MAENSGKHWKKAEDDRRWPGRWRMIGVGGPTEEAEDVV